ncbi:hypothetical protein FRC98_17100 [Lujinxingia vulgaris]|uniref:Uncharacterized protein n=2 Tax=Lujinxingia vulgaris TaxID=2600176 RepID=A0A5C6X4H9_9DELT|nr:hypothetical protein FRC98_17100 [Lujinxingia vulgaris]
MIDSAQAGSLQFDEHYTNSTIDVACEIDDAGLRLQARVPSPVSGCEDEEDVLPLMVFDYDENGSVNQTAYPGPWSGLAIPLIHTFNGDNGTCHTRPLFEQDYSADFTTDAEGITTVDIVISGQFDDSFGGTYVNFESTFVFDADACQPYDSGDPACGGGQTECAYLPAGELCTDSGCSTGSRCTYPTQEECAALDATACQQNQQCEYFSAQDRCMLGTGFSFYPENCQHPQVTDQGQAFCESQGCVWREACTGSAISCQDVALEDDLMCSGVFGCTW